MTLWNVELGVTDVDKATIIKWRQRVREIILTGKSKKKTKLFSGKYNVYLRTENNYFISWTSYKKHF